MNISQTRQKQGETRIVRLRRHWNQAALTQFRGVVLDEFAEAQNRYSEQGMVLYRCRKRKQVGERDDDMQNWSSKLEHAILVTQRHLDDLVDELEI